jgi:hypothetical protein
VNRLHLLPVTLPLVLSAALPQSRPSVLGVFEGRTPCGRIAVEFTGFPGVGCEKIKWRLTLYQDSVTGRPTTFKYQGTRTTREGTWVLSRGTPSDPGATVIRLTPAAPHPAIAFQKVDDVLLLMDGTGKAVVGDASWSYTLNRVDPPAGRAPPR